MLDDLFQKLPKFVKGKFGTTALKYTSADKNAWTYIFVKTDSANEEIDQAGNHWSHQQRISNPLSNQATGQGLLTFFKVFVTEIRNEVERATLLSRKWGQKWHLFWLISSSA